MRAFALINKEQNMNLMKQNTIALGYLNIDVCVHQNTGNRCCLLEGKEVVIWGRMKRGLTTLYPFDYEPCAHSKKRNLKKQSLVLR